jgi:drug/metabolite transporter (DMT)-like permease
MTVAGPAGPKKTSHIRLRSLVARVSSAMWRRSSRPLRSTRRMRARSGWEALPLAGRAVLLMVTGCLLFSIMGALVKLLGQRLGSSQIAFFRCFFGFIAILPFFLLTPGRHAFSRPIFAAISCAARLALRG